MDAMNHSEALENYSELLKDVLEENDLMDKPSQIYNVDMPLDHRPPHVLTSKGHQKVNKRLDTVLLAISLKSL